MRRVTRIAVLLAPSMLASAALAGPTAYATNGLFSTLADQDDLIMFDVDNPAGDVVIGQTGLPNIGFGGLDFDAKGDLIACASFYRSTGGAASGIYRIDINTGAATPIGFTLQTLEDLAFNPVDGEMYGIRSQITNTKLFHVNTDTGAVTEVGEFTGLPEFQRGMGFAIDSNGVYYLHDMLEDKIYTAGADLVMTELYSLPQDTGFSQGMTIDWSRGDQGYHAATGQGEFPNYFTTLNLFSTDGSSYTVGQTFGDQIDGGDNFFYPPVECNDIAIVPGSGGCNVADLAEPLGTLDFSDVTAFLVAFAAEAPEADLDAPTGVFDFSDVVAFLGAFGAGCP